MPRPKSKPVPHTPELDKARAQTLGNFGVKVPPELLAIRSEEPEDAGAFIVRMPRAMVNCSRSNPVKAIERFWIERIEMLRVTGGQLTMDEWSVVRGLFADGILTKPIIADSSNEDGDADDPNADHDSPFKLNVSAETVMKDGKTNGKVNGKVGTA